VNAQACGELAGSRDVVESTLYIILFTGRMRRCRASAGVLLFAWCSSWLVSHRHRL